MRDTTREMEARFLDDDLVLASLAVEKFFFVLRAFSLSSRVPSRPLEFRGCPARRDAKGLCASLLGREANLAPSPTRPGASQLLKNSFLWLVVVVVAPRRRLLSSRPFPRAAFAARGSLVSSSPSPISPLPLNCNRHAGNRVERKKRIDGAGLSGEWMRESFSRRATMTASSKPNSPLSRHFGATGSDVEKTSFFSLSLSRNAPFPGSRLLFPSPPTFVAVTGIRGLEKEKAAT